MKVLEESRKGQVSPKGEKAVMQPADICLWFKLHSVCVRVCVVAGVCISLCVCVCVCVLDPSPVLLEHLCVVSVDGLQISLSQSVCVCVCVSK